MEGLTECLPSHTPESRLGSPLLKSDLSLTALHLSTVPPPTNRPFSPSSWLAAQTRSCPCPSPTRHPTSPCHIPQVPDGTG